VSRGCHLCGGNDDTPPEHAGDCSVSIARSVDIEKAVRSYLKKATIASRKRLVDALAVSRLCEPDRCMEVHNGLQCIEKQGHGWMHTAHREGGGGVIRAITWNTPMRRVPPR